MVQAWLRSRSYPAIVHATRKQVTPGQGLPEPTCPSLDQFPPAPQPEWGRVRIGQSHESLDFSQSKRDADIPLRMPCFCPQHTAEFVGDRPWGTQRRPMRDQNELMFPKLCPPPALSPSQTLRAESMAFSKKVSRAPLRCLWNLMLLGVWPGWCPAPGPRPHSPSSV